MSKSLCCIDKCLTKSSSIKVKDIIYYLFPAEEEWASKWEKKIKAYDSSFVRETNSMICSLHFAKTSMVPITRNLVDHAEPVFFPKTSNRGPVVDQDTSKLSKQLTNSGSTSSTVNGSCCISGCQTKFDDKHKGFEFPKSENRRTLWSYLIKLYHNQDIQFNDKLRICRVHFKSGLISTKDGQEILDPSADPQIFAVKNADKPRLGMNNSQQREQATSRVMPPPQQPIHTQATKNSQQIRCAPIAARRMSLPVRNSFAALPTLTPKPKILQIQEAKQAVLQKRVIQRESMPAPQVTSINSVGSLLTTLQSSTGKTINTIKMTTARPIPQLNVLNVPALMKTRGITSSLVEAPTSSTNILLKTPIPTSTVVSTNISNRPIIRKVYSFNRNQATLPQLTPSNEIKQQINNQRNVQVPVSVVKIHQNFVQNAAITTMPNANRLIIPHKSPSDSMRLRVGKAFPDVVMVDDANIEIVQSVDPTEIQTTHLIGKRNGSDQQIKRRQYAITENAMKLPRLLADRIAQNKRKNKEEIQEVVALKKKYHKILTAAKLQSLPGGNIETIEIS